MRDVGFDREDDVSVVSWLDPGPGWAILKYVVRGAVDANVENGACSVAGEERFR
jgi:hypothetical protein